MKVSIIIPVRNEEHTLKKIVNKLEDGLKNLPHEIIFINDFSNDSTKNILSEISETKSQINFYDNAKT